jgi:hypothetical protein
MVVSVWFDEERVPGYSHLDVARMLFQGEVAPHQSFEPGLRDHLSKNH